MAKKDKAAGKPSSSGPKTIESLDDDQVYSLTEQHRQTYERLMKSKKDADTAIKNFGRMVKADLGASGLADIKDIIASQTEGGEMAIKAEVERRMRVLRWMSVPIGTIEDLFPKLDAAPLDERAFNAGKRDGLAGKSRNNPHHHTISAHKQYEEGYVEGQTTLASGFKTKTEGALPKEQWSDQMRKQNEATEAEIKASSTLGSSRPSYEMQ